MSEETDLTKIQISARGKLVNVPAVHVCNDFLVLRGRWLKIASIFDEELKENDVNSPHEYILALNAVAKRGFNADIFTFTQKATNRVPQYNYMIEYESIAGIQLHSFKTWWDKLPQTTRKNVRRAKKRGVTAKVVPFGEDLIRHIMEVNDDSPFRQGRKSWHYGKTQEEVYRDYCSYAERSDFVCAYIGDEIIGFSQIIYKGDVAILMQLTPKPSREDARPSNAMLAKLVELCEAKGVTCITYGRFNYGNKGKTKLREFKERNGFEEIMVPRYYVPLSKFGRMSLALRAHRGAIGILPRSVLKAGFNLRELWYKYGRRPV